ncbi:DUF2254 domain-containing protein [Blastococcus sp. TF02A-30]|uniref:DUF2254 domain-containing protein n=1 Tax=Blastococcus sp. TF02A-30 TaxID=2250580 RepID=UPI0013144AD5|nr:DUF2254 domain-containing protein [Blastococcus sp. TF02A-30]
MTGAGAPARRAGGSRWTALRLALTGTLWPLPALAVALAVGLGVALPAVDEALAYGDHPITFVFGGGPSAARTMLSAIASSLISVTTLLLSLTIVTLQLASSQYSPRLLQTFVRDRVVQTCLGVLLGTFVYALVVLRTVRSADEDAGGAFVPRLSVSVAFVLTLASVAALVAFLNHQTRQLRAETMMRDVHAEASATLHRLADQLADQPAGGLPAVPPHARPVCARRSGFLVQVREDPLLDALTATRTRLRLVPRPGDPVVEGTPVAWAWADTPDPDTPDAGVPVDELAEVLDRGLLVAHERQDEGDPSYGLRKLVDIVVRGLSPGINDPTTAVHALSHVSALLGALASRSTWHRRVTDASGAERLTVPSWEFAALLDLALTQPRCYGHRDAAVVERLFALLAETAWRTTAADQRKAVDHQRQLLVEQVSAAPPVGRTREDVATWSARIGAALAGDWPRP